MIIFTFYVSGGETQAYPPRSKQKPTLKVDHPRLGLGNAISENTPLIEHRRNKTKKRNRKEQR